MQSFDQDQSADPVPPDVRYWHKADVVSCTAHVRYSGEADMRPPSHFSPAASARRGNARFEQNYGMKHKTGPVLLCCKGSMTNAHAMKLLSPRTRSLLHLHAEAIGVDEARLASDLYEMMVRDAQSLGGGDRDREPRQT